jgi:cytochrome c5
LKRSLIPALVAVIVGVWAYAVPPGTTEEIAERIKPFGSVCRAGEDCGAAVAAISSGPLSGQAVYDQFCFACHAAGVGGAPLLGDTAQWQPRIDKGMDVLMASTLNGINAMPAKGTCMNCSDDELQAAVEYMLEQVQ